MVRFLVSYCDNIDLFYFLALSYRKNNAVTRRVRLAIDFRPQYSTTVLFFCTDNHATPLLYIMPSLY